MQNFKFSLCPFILILLSAQQSIEPAIRETTKQKQKFSFNMV